MVGLAFFRAVVILHPPKHNANAQRVFNRVRPHVGAHSSGRGHGRRNIFNAEFNVMGCFSAEHKDFNMMSCVDYCGAFVAQGEPDPIEK